MLVSNYFSIITWAMIVSAVIAGSETCLGEANAKTRAFDLPGPCAQLAQFSLGNSSCCALILLGKLHIPKIFGGKLMVSSSKVCLLPGLNSVVCCLHELHATVLFV